MEVVVPDLGEFSDVEIIEIIVSPGDVVEAESPLITLETDKAAMDVPAPAAGRIVELKVGTGDRVSAGDVIAILEPESETLQLAAVQDTPSFAIPKDAESPSTDQTLLVGGSTQVLEQIANRRAVQVPDLGDFENVEVIELLVAPGDAVDVNDGLITLETDKAAMDVPSTVAGVVDELKVAVGDRVSAGDEIAILLAKPRGDAEAAKEEAIDAAEEQSGAGGDEALEIARGAETPPPMKAAAPGTRPATVAAAKIDEAGFGRAHASPSVRKLARELGVDLGRVQGSGRKQRVTAADVKSYVKGIMLGGAALPSVPEVDFAQFGEIEAKPLTRIQKISGPRLHASWVNIPHVTQNDAADITELEAARQRMKDDAKARGIRLTPLAFIVRACVLALDEFPVFKSSLSSDGESLIYKHYTHIGFAADTPNGLVVPVIRDAATKDVLAIAAELGELSGAARGGKLRAADMQGGVFTISSLGGIGGTSFTPIINAPEVAILGVSRSRWQPVFQDGEFVPRLMLPLSLSYDHRVIDGAEAVRFTTRLCEILADVDLLMTGEEQ